MAPVPKPSENEQLRAIFFADGKGTWELAQRYCAGDMQALDELWTVGLEDLVAYVEEHDIPPGWFHRQPGTHDGVYLYEDGPRWLVKRRERGVDENVGHFDTYASGLRELLSRYYLPSARRSEP